MIKINKEGIIRWFNNPILEIVIRVIVILSIFAMLLLNTEVSNTSNCLRDYIRASGVASNAARTAAAEDRKVIDDLIIKFTKAKTGKDAAKALADYLAARQANDAIRAAHPVPDATNVCS